MARTILMVAEKPSLAESIAHHLSNGRANKKQRALPIYEYPGTFQNHPAFFKVTSTTGHVFSCDFTPQHQNWEKTDEESLFSAPTMRKDAGNSKVVQHLQRESEGCDALVLWLDCDREGENICFEVMDVVKRNISSLKNIFRAKFSAITYQELSHAMNTLGRPNKAVSDAVETRQELDLKVGVAFTRFQTKYFQGKYGNLDASVVSYGPCQTPTLAFCVQRHDEILNFKPESFWRIVPSTNRGGVLLQFEWERGRIFDEPIARLMHRKVSETKCAAVTAVTKSNESKVRPTALNTVELLKVASRTLGLGPHHAMAIAEHLYISGYISYPRTESSAYPPSFDLNGALQQLNKGSQFGSYVNNLLNNGITRPKHGKDAGDHPPITPMRLASPQELSGDQWRLYDYVVRHFIATLSPDCKIEKTKITILLGGEVFSASGKTVIDHGWTEIMKSEIKDDKMPSDIKRGDDMHLSDIRLQSGHTQPPGYLTEADLIGLMEKHGIGTDASIPTHINNICERNYCSVQAGRTLVPTKLGVVLVHGIQNIDPELTLPMVRGRVEEYVTQIADGKAQKDEVLSYALHLFTDKFHFFKKNIEKMDVLFDASFSSLSTTGRYISRCGNCTRYLRHISTRPQRLYCQHCEVTYNLPQGGTIKPYGQFTCPLDNFELVICHIEGGKSLPICPYCYNNPPFDGFGGKAMSCADCKQPTCRHSLATNYVCDCVDDNCKGCMVFEPGSTGKWKVSCNMCVMHISLPAVSSKVNVDRNECEDCGAKKLSLEFPANKSPLVTRETHLTACIFCHPTLSLLCHEVAGKIGYFGRSRGSGGRGRGRGSGGRGGRGGRGRGKNHN
eukprot:Tbor_TRINITY_DN3901_c0_g1::TRINITY_DN3901_c0_g1_i1::g.824::m.824/K03165/TOP3; DNA topoisomerase III